MSTIQERIHLALCEGCGKRVAWSRKRRRWLALAPTTAPSQLQRRMVCASPLGFHRAPSLSFADRIWRDYITARRAAA